MHSLRISFGKLRVFSRLVLRKSKLGTPSMTVLDLPQVNPGILKREDLAQHDTFWGEALICRWCSSQVLCHSKETARFCDNKYLNPLYL